MYELGYPGPQPESAPEAEIPRCPLLGFVCAGLMALSRTLPLA